MTLDGLEAKLAEKFPKAKQRGLKMHMVRYADDFIITGDAHRKRFEYSTTTASLQGSDATKWRVQDDKHGISGCFRLDNVFTA
jgi:hypothetical protein